MSSKRDLSADTKREEYFRRVNEIFPELKTSTARSMFSGTHPTSATIEIGNQGLAFRNKFDYTGQIIHYTGLESLFNILNSETVRLYNCQNLNDNTELKYAIKTLGFGMSEEDILKQKNYFFVLSGSKYNPEINDEDFNLWRLYGDAGLGAAIVFEINNPNDSWQNIFYGQVSYGLDTNLNQQMLKFIRVHTEFNNEYGLFENVPSIIPAIALHFKNKIWSIENEVRLIAYCPFDQETLETDFFSGGNTYLSATLKHTINRSGTQGAYVELPLNIEKLRTTLLKQHPGKDVDKYLTSIPHLKVKRIILGHRVSENTFTTIYQILCDSISKRLGCEIQLGYSDFHTDLS